MKRLFLALKAQLDDYDAIKEDFSGVVKGRWIAEENLHITLCFFGDNYSTDELLEKLPSVLQEIEPLELGSLDYFSANKILYAEVKSPQLELLYSSICEVLPVPETKEFIPHVTLMRIKKIEDEKRFKDMLDSYKKRTLGRVETTLQLMQSHSHPKGVKYESIKKF